MYIQIRSLSTAARLLAIQHTCLKQCLKSVLLFYRSAEILQLRVFAIELDCVWKTIGIIERIAVIDLRVLVLLYSFDDSGQFHHDLLHPLQQLIIVLVARFIRQPLHNWRLFFEYSRKVYIFGENRILYTSQLHLKIQIFLLKTQLFESLLFAVSALTQTDIGLGWGSFHNSSIFKFFLLLILLHIYHQLFIDVARVLFCKSFVIT